MRVFVTGASGWIGSAATTELLARGHEVVGLARSDAAAARIAELGAEVRRGSIDDPAGLRDGAAAADAVVHLAYNHDFSRMADAARTDSQAIEAFGEVLAGTDRPLLIASGVAGLASGTVATEDDRPAHDGHPRLVNAAAALALAERGVRSCVVRFAPTVHGAGDYGFVPVLVATARAKGVSAYVGDGTNVWPAVHRSDAGRLVALATESAPAGSIVHAVAEQGIATRAIAETIGRGLGVPVTSVPAEEAGAHFDWMGQFFAADLATSSELTRARFGWRPTGPGLLADLEQGHYFAAPPS
ncbi:Nucleoside-diphosphate-sugar epimerase [Jatrophihabitans endophyticus]|uniref:Nucleoside-diphosphate-sugar epimerase n=1 Tax=Jatrophihabitans endophyticus TaxID=1206085 RepID=A0A1M5KIV9_9ACTN|nr:SDR family oxidoreductase [Jatrophihabitans endophyticus]SHG52648.1 Nucleoside-diphosphate-sugar epimerase [Jatrophihabitans endophyticus]